MTIDRILAMGPNEMRLDYEEAQIFKCLQDATRDLQLQVKRLEKRVGELERDKRSYGRHG